MSDERPRAVLDVGSNTVRLLVARPRDGDLETALDRSEFVRLGLGVDTSGELRPDRADAAIAAIERLAEVARSAGAEEVRAIATSAVRDAKNGPSLAERVRSRTGVELEIISGEREAALTYLGATLGLDVESGVIVCDLGGGSAELIHADESGIRWARSEPLGSGRLSERFVSHDPPAPHELSQVRHYVAGVLRSLPPARVERAIFTGGTATHAARLAGAEGVIETLDAETLEWVGALVASRSVADVVAEHGIREERAQVLPAGITTVQTIALYYAVNAIVVTRHGMREGAILERLQRDE